MCNVDRCLPAERDDGSAPILLLYLSMLAFLLPQSLRLSVLFELLDHLLRDEVST